MGFSTLTAVSPTSPTTEIVTAFAEIPSTVPEPSVTTSVPSCASPPDGSTRTSVTTPLPSIVPTVAATPLLLTTTASSVAIATTAASVNVVTPPLLVPEPPADDVSLALSLMYAAPPAPGAMEMDSAVFTRAPSPSATYATLPPIVAFSLTLMSPAVERTYLSAVAWTAAFSVMPISALSVTFLPFTAPLTDIPPPLIASTRTSPRLPSTPASRPLTSKTAPPGTSPLCVSLTDPLSAVAEAFTPPTNLFQPCVSVMFLAVRSATPPSTTSIPSWVISPSVASIVTASPADTRLFCASEDSPSTIPPSVSRKDSFFTEPNTLPILLSPLSSVTSFAPPGSLILAAFTTPSAVV